MNNESWEHVLVQGIGLGHVFQRKNDRREVFRGVDFEVRRGERVWIKGGSGCGKTTLLHILSGMLRPTWGNVRLFDQDMHCIASNQMQRIRRERMAVVFQHLSWLEDYNVLENIAFPLYISGNTMQSSCLQAEDIAKRLGLGHVLSERCQSLSGGERARVAFARAMVIKPELLFADEPTGSLDASLAKKLWEDLFTLFPNTTLVVVSHDPWAKAYASRVVEFSELFS